MPAIIAAIAGTGSLKFAPETRYIPPGAGEMEPDGEDWVVPGRRYIIKRPRLTRLLDGSKARVRMLIAPAGYGKTTLAREWFEKRPHAWYQGTAASADVAALAAGLALHVAIQTIDPKLSPDLKWPNDLLLDGKKLSGILTEMNAEATRVRHIVIGIGINVNQASFPPELRDQATSLRLSTATEWSRVELTATLLKSLDREYRNLLEKPEARQSILRRFEESSSSVRGREVRVEENGGFEGTTAGLDARGFLQVRTAHGMRTVLSGTVRFLK